MLLKLNAIIIYSLIAFFLSLMLYPLYISLLKKRKAGKTIRDASVTWEEASIFKALHQHKAGTPTMWWWLILFVVLLMVLLSVVINKLWRTNHSLLARQETYILLFAFFSMWILWLIDDYLNIKWKSAVKWLTAKIKFIWMFWFSAFITYWFYVKLGIDFVNIWPFWWRMDIGILYAIITFVLTVWIVNAINIADGLDGLVWWLMLMVLWTLAVVTFISQWYLATTIIWIVLWATLAFLWFNINPAYIFMGDSWALAFWWLIAALVYLLNIRFWIIVPFILMFWIFRMEIGSSFLQIMWKKICKKKLFSVAPFHHALEHAGHAEHSIVMKLWLVQAILGVVALMGILYQVQL